MVIQNTFLFLNKKIGHVKVIMARLKTASKYTVRLRVMKQ